MQKKILGSMLVLTFLGAITASASVNLVDKGDWKFDVYGFAQTDMTQDSTRSFNEVIGNSSVSRPNTLAGDNGRTADSIRNSRLGFIATAPVQNGWKAKGVLEYDLLGYDPYANVSPPTNSEASFSQNPTMRVRHSYFNAEKDGLRILAGQTWSLFGWQPYYFPAVLSVAPEAGELYQRTAQFGAIETCAVGENGQLQTGVSMERPSQKDSNMPNFNIGVRYSLDSYKTAVASSYGDYGLQPLSIGISGTFRQFETFQTGGSMYSQIKQNASAIAVDTLIPIHTNSDAKSPGNSLSISAEFTSGTGIADELSGWTGGMTGGTAFSTSTPWTNTNLDAGFMYFDAAGNANLIQLSTFNVALQYVLPTEMKQNVNVGMAQTSSNLNSFTVTAGGTVAGGNGIGAVTNVYDKVTNQFVNYWVDCTDQIRLGAEVSTQTTHYVSDGMTTTNNRAQITALYRF